MEVILENGAVELRKERVVKKWEQDFFILYSGQMPNSLDSVSYDLSIKVKEDLEFYMCYGASDRYQSNRFLNFNITLQEVDDALKKPKLRKAMGVEEIPNEVLKSPSLLNALYDLFYFLL